MEPKRERTIKIRFGAQNRNPSNEEVFNFFRKHEWSCDDLSAMYREDFSVFVRFQSESFMKQALAKLGPQTTFEYANGTSIQVSVREANGNFKYIRLFGLPPDVGDNHIAPVLSKYGTIQQMVRERYPAESGYPIWNGVRGVHMEVIAEIPAQLQIQHIKARVFYEGMQSKCFGCGALDHLKASCPKRTSVNTRLDAAVAGQDQGNQDARGSTFADIVTGGRMATPSTSGMVVLTKESEVKAATTNSVDAVNKPVREPEVSGAMESNSKASEEKEEGMEWETKKGAKKRGRAAKNKDSDTSESESAGGKQLIVPAARVDLFLAQKGRSRSLNTRSKSRELPSNTPK